MRGIIYTHSWFRRHAKNLVWTTVFVCVFACVFSTTIVVSSVVLIVEIVWCWRWLWDFSFREHAHVYLCNLLDDGEVFVCLNKYECVLYFYWKWLFDFKHSFCSFVSCGFQSAIKSLAMPGRGKTYIAVVLTSVWAEKRKYQSQDLVYKFISSSYF